MRAERAFTARSVSTFSLDPLCRVYSSGNQLVFIKISGQNGVARAIAPHFGLVGQLIFAWWQKKSRKKLQDRLAAEERQDLEILLARDPKNFLLNSGQIVRATIEPPSFLGGHGHLGVWKLEETTGKKHTFHFEDLSDMREAMAILPAVLGPSLTILAEWNEKKKAYTKLSASRERDLTTVSR